MYITYVFNWLYKIMQLPVPLVLSEDVFGLVTIFDIFMFTVYVAIFIILIRYIITDSLSLDVGGYSINYSSSAYLPKRLKKSLSKNDKDNNDSNSIKNIKVYSNDSIGGRILNRKNLKSMNSKEK